MPERLEEAGYLSREETMAWLKARIAQLEEELRVLKTLLAMLEGRGEARPGERVEEVKLGRRRIARLYRGEGYIRLVPDFPMPLPSDLREYLESVADEIRSTRGPGGGEDEPRLSVRESPGGGVAEISYTGLESTLDYLKARAALKFVAETAWEIYKAQRRRQPDT